MFLCRTLCGKRLRKALWSQLVTKVVMESNITVWSINICMYSSLTLYRNVIPGLVACLWWQLADSMPLVRQCCQSVIQIINGDCVSSLKTIDTIRCRRDSVEYKVCGRQECVEYKVCGRQECVEYKVCVVGKSVWNTRCVW